MHDEINPTPTLNAFEPAPEPAAAGSALLHIDEERSRKLRDLTLRQLNRFIAYEAKALKGDDADAIHGIRVTSRRLQQHLNLLYSKPRPKEVRRWRRQIRRCRQILGEVRNCDVLLELVGGLLRRKRAARREAWTAVQHFLLLRRSESFLRAMRKFGKINFAPFYVNLKEFLQHDKAHDHSTVHQAQGTEALRPAFIKDLTGALESTWSGFEEHIEQSHRHTRPEVIHRARIATKRLRYLLEVFHEFGVAGSADALAWLRRLQKHLGEWHDLEVLEQMMIEMLARPEFLRAHLPLAMEVEKLILRNREHKMQFEQKYAGMSMESGEMRGLKEWISYLLASPSRDFVKA